MKYLLDSDICIYVIKKQPKNVWKQFHSLNFSDMALSAVTVAELRYGVAKSRAKERNEAALEEFLAPLRIMPFDETATTVYGEIRADLARKGTPIGPLDMLIAAQAVSLGVTLVTNNLREYRRVPGLHCVSWA